MAVAPVNSSHKQPYCFKAATITLIISAVALIMLGHLALHSRLPKSLAQFHRLLFFCKINPIYSIMMIVGGALLYLMGLFGLAHFK